METTGVKQVHPVFKVTTLSKYLAMVLFILMPFIGGYVGYVYAPEKVVEKTVIKENSAEENRQALLPNYIAVSSEEKITLQKQFIDLEEMLKVAPYEWELSDPYKESRLLEFNPKGDDGCYSNSAVCEQIVLRGDLYSYRFLTTDQVSSSTSEFSMIQLGGYLKSRGFIFIREVAKGWQFEETYQKTIGNKVQIINISSRPINLTFPQDGGYPTADGKESRIFVSSVFEVPKD